MLQFLAMDDSISSLADGDYSLVGGFVQDDANSMIAVGKALAKTCWDQRCDFVINTGDNFYVLGIDATLGPADPQWDIFFNNVFNSKILNRVRILPMSNATKFLLSLFFPPLLQSKRRAWQT